jgi:hypothetical protein
MTLKEDAGGKIEGDSEDGPTGVRGSEESIRIEIVCC